MNEKKTRILIADDQQLFAESLGYVLEARARDLEVIGMASGGAEAIRMAVALRPDIILMDVRMPDIDGVEATRQILLTAPDTKIVMLTTFGEDEYVHYALRQGAVGYLLKNIAPNDVIEAIRVVRRGGKPMAPSVKQTEEGRNRAGNETDERADLLRSLTKREKLVLSLLLGAADNREIGRRIGVADQTVRNYISSVYFKLGVENRMQLLKLMDELKFMLDHT